MRKTTSENVKRIASCILENRRNALWYLLGFVLVSGAIPAIHVFIALSVRDMINGAVSRTFAVITQGALFMGFVLCVGLVLFPAGYYIHSRACRFITRDITVRAYKRLLVLPASFFDRYHSGEILSRLNNDINVLSGAYGSQLHAFAGTVLNGIVSMVFMLLLNWKVGLIFAVISAVAASVNLLFMKPIREGSHESQQSVAKMSERFGDLLDGIFIIKMYRAGDRILKNFTEANREAAEATVQLNRKRAVLEAVDYFMGMAGYAGVLAIGSIFVIGGTMDFGTLVAMTELQTTVTQSLLEVGKNIAELQAALAGADRVFELIEAEPEPECIRMEETGAGNYGIQMNNVSFSYDEKPVLKTVNIAVEKGQTAALVGPSGGGKSTLLKLILGFGIPDTGGIRICGMDMAHTPVTEIRRNIAWVPQDCYLFEGTVRDNIRIGRQEATDADIENAARAAFAHEFIKELPEGYDTRVGERGARLSGGQRQRIAIARALLKDSPVLLLDEATSALDSQSEQEVQKALEVLMKGRTVLTIAHRLSTVENADVIYVIENGSVAEKGTHRQLIENGGVYKELCDIQFAG